MPAMSSALFRLLFLAVVAFAPPSLAAVPLPVPVTRTATDVRADNGKVAVHLDLKTGRFSVEWKNRASVRGAIGAVRLQDGQERKTADYLNHVCANKDIVPVRDGFGYGVRLTVHHRQTGKPELNQIFTVYAGRPEIYVQLETVSAGAAIASSYIAPVVVESGGGGIDLEAGDPLQVLFVPFDNDMFVRYNSQEWGPEADSYEVTALYDNASRGGMVIGSVDHDLWKTGFALRDRGPHHMGGLRVYGGATGFWSHDKEPHGAVEGKTIRSPRIFLGWFSDWRDGMEAFGKANAVVKPALAWSGGIPFGWNSWAAHKETLKAADADAAVDFFADPTVSFVFKSDGPRFINLDSFWDFLKHDDLIAFVRRAHASGQKAGIYWTPFTAWGELDSPVEGTNGKYTYRDLTIKDSRNEPLPRLDGGWPLDPTHPGTQARNAFHYARFVEWGFDYLKLDFLSHGSLEGVRFDKSVSTGIAAYNVGMKQIVEAFDPKRVGRPFFLSLSIAPLFPQGYAHSRRISCDAFANIGQTEYLLNSVSYGWWTHNTLYRYNDPDHSVVYQTHGELPVSFAEGQSRLTASLTAGGMLLNGDNLTDTAAKERVRALFTKPAIIALAKKGRTFRPVEGNTGSAAADTFTLYDPDEKVLYAAVFNFDGKTPADKTLDFARLGLRSAVRFRVHNLWTGQDSFAQDTLSLHLEPAACVLLRFKR